MRHLRPHAAARHRARPPEERSLTELTPRLVGSFPRADVVLADPLPEVAFLGRSNVGKSSLINAFVGQRIARVSATPGKTRLLNVFEMPLRGEGYVVDDGAGRPSGSHRVQPPTTHHAFYLLDLPGYGYAKASQAERAGFRQLVEGVVHRDRLIGVVWLLDVRREPSSDDLAMQDAFAAGGTPVLAAVTKGDKVPRRDRERRLATLRQALALPDEQVIATSARTGEGIDELRDAIAALVRSAGA